MRSARPQTPPSSRYTLSYPAGSGQSQCLVVGPQPVVVEVQLVVVRPHLFPLAQAEDAVRVVAVLADAVQLVRVVPRFGDELIWSSRYD